MWGASSSMQATLLVQFHFIVFCSLSYFIEGLNCLIPLCVLFVWFFFSLQTLFFRRSFPSSKWFKLNRHLFECVFTKQYFRFTFEILCGSSFNVQYFEPSTRAPSWFRLDLNKIIMTKSKELLVIGCYNFFLLQIRTAEGQSKASETPTTLPNLFLGFVFPLSSTPMRCKRNKQKNVSI